MTLGFTGTSKGMTEPQRASVFFLFLRQLQITVLHHGDCIGADAQAHQDAVDLGLTIIVHPPSDSKKRAYCSQTKNNLYPRIAVRAPKPYLARNKDIVAEGVDGLIAAPSGVVEQMRGSGTWATVRYARKAGRRIWIVLPDGTVQYEQGLWINDAKASAEEIKTLLQTLEKEKRDGR